MALSLSPLSQVCKGIRSYLYDEINGPDRTQVNVVLATPADTASVDAADGAHRLNMFFYRFEPAGLFPDTLPGETGWLRAFCLITPFAGDEDGVLAGENDLRLVGEVVRIFHEKPVFVLDIDGESYHLQVVFQPLGLDQLNQLWSTQGDTIYRPSVLYEVSLAPVVPAEPAKAAPLTANAAVEVRSGSRSGEPAAAARPAGVPPMAPDIARMDWAPALAFVHQGACAFSLGFVLGSQALQEFTPRVWLAGKVGESVKLRWQTWDAGSGWQTVEPAVDAVVADRRIDPERTDGAALLELSLPFDDRVGQMLLHAERQYTRAADSAVVTVRSNPLLISLYPV